MATFKGHPSVDRNLEHSFFTLLPMVCSCLEALLTLGLVSLAAWAGLFLDSSHSN